MSGFTINKVRSTSGLLVSLAPPYSPNALMPDNGLALLAAVLKNSGHHVQVMDLCTTNTIRMLFPPKQQRKLAAVFGNIQSRLEQNKKPKAVDIGRLWLLSRELGRLEGRVALSFAADLGRTIKEREVDWIGFKLWNGAGFTMPAVIVNELKRRNPNLQIFGGGSHVDYFREHIFTRANFDLLVYGHGFEALRRQADRIGGSGEEISSIPNTIYRTPQGFLSTDRHRITGVDLNSLPFPDYSVEAYPAMNGQKIKVIVVVDSEGCNNFCKFCGHPDKSGGRIIERHPSLIVEEMERLQKLHGFTHFRFSGSSTPGSLLSRIADILLERNLKYRYTTFGRFKDAIVGDYPKLRQAGHFGQFFGIESADQLIIDGIGKGFSVEQARAIAAASMEQGYFTVLSFIASPPGEREETSRLNLDFIRSISPSSVIINPPFVIPGTPWAERPQDFGIQLGFDYLSRMMAYPVKYMLPPPLWPKLPYRVNGKSSGRIFKEVMGMEAAVRALGIPTAIPDDIALMAAAAGISAVELSREAGLSFMTGDADRIDGLAARINRGIVSY